MLLLFCLLLSFSSDFAQLLFILSLFTFGEDLYSVLPGKKTYPLLRTFIQYCESHSLPCTHEMSWKSSVK